jgi:hypothetical protein
LTIIIREDGIVTKSREEIRYMGECMAKGLEELGLCPKIDVDGKKIRTLGILIQNCWLGPVLIYTGLYLCCAGNFIYTDPPDHYYYNINQGLFDTLVLGTSMFDAYLKPLEQKEIRAVKNLILEEGAPADYVEKFKSYGMNIYYLKDVIEKGKTSTVKLERPTRDTEIFVLSTSGSTGNPKGAVVHDRLAFITS